MSEVTKDDVMTLVGHAQFLRMQGDTDMPNYFFDLAERLARQIGGSHLADRIKAMTPTLRPMRSATMGEKLKPCPFCGGNPALEDHRTIWAVRCDCGVCMLGERAPEPDGTEPESYWDGIRQTAIDAWNRRERDDGRC